MQSGHCPIFYLPAEFKVIYESQDGREDKGFEAFEWWAARGSQVPDKGEPRVRDYGIL